MPYLKQHSLADHGIDWLVITHASADHFGGNHAIKRHFPSVKIISHWLDAKAIENRQTFLTEHKSWCSAYGFGAQQISAEDMDQLFGIPVAVDLAFSDSVHIALADDWNVELIHAPGHTPGHCIVFDHKHAAIYAGDAVLGMGVPDLNGDLTMPPHYFEVDWYLETIQKLIALKPEYLFLTHYPPLCGSEVNDFLERSSSYVYACMERLEAILKSSGGRLNSHALLQRLRSQIGITSADNQYQLLLRAHLNHLRKYGNLSIQKNEDQITWVYSDRTGDDSGQGRRELVM